MNLLREGEPIGIFYGYVEDGYDDKGKICYVDYNNDGKINEYDKQIIGDPNPDFTFGLSSALSYKGFTLSLYMQGSVGNDIYSLSMASLCYNYAGSRGINPSRRSTTIIGRPRPLMLPFRHSRRVQQLR